ncbi:MAG TPA: hypothetical protein VGX00_03995 [Thermoplasmata archaeon]|nr:hypothetical protein [Thermoplasmata archaeon]
MEDGAATAAAPPKRRDTWSIRRIAEEIGGRPIEDFQNGGPTAAQLAQYGPVVVETLPPRSGGRSAGPSAAGHGAPGARKEAEGSEPAEELDPVARIYPPLTRSVGRALHGATREHHLATLAGVRADPEPPEPGRPPHRPGPSTRPERIYLHYLLLHLDRLSDHALAYLWNAVREEVASRQTPPPP